MLKSKIGPGRVQDPAEVAQLKAGLFPRLQEKTLILSAVCLEESCGYNPEEKTVQEVWMIFMDHLLQAQGPSISKTTKSS